MLPNQKVYDAENHEDKDFINVMRKGVYALDFYIYSKRAML